MHTGVLILRGEGDMGEVWKNIIEEVPKSIAFGNARQPDDVRFLESQGETSMQEVLLELHRKVKGEPYTYLIWSDELPKKAYISNRSSTISLWMDGGVVPPDQEDEPIKMLTRLNSAPSGDQQSGNYSELVRDRVINKIKVPKYAMTMVYVGMVKPSFILNNKKMMMHIWLVVVDGIHLLVWSTQYDLVNNMMKKMDQVKQHLTSINKIDFPVGSLLTIHPMYLISKLNSQMRKLDPSRKLALGITYVKNYLERQSLRVFNPVEIED